MAKRISTDTPLAELTFRKYEKSKNLSLRELVRKLCLSIGLLQPGDSRDIVVDILHVLLTAQKNKKKLTSEEIRYEVCKLRKKYKLPLHGVASSNIRRQLIRLRLLFLAEKVGNHYRINENAKLSDIFKEKIEKYYLESIKGRVRDYFKEVELKFA